MRTLFLCCLIVLIPGCSLFDKNPAKLKPEMVKIKGGEFTMGDVFFHADPDATPVHQVKVEDFYIGKYEVTFEQYDEFTQLTGRKPIPDYHYGRKKRAVVRVTWDEALAYCRFFGYRLPTEAEWEYAARSGGKKDLYSGTSEKDSLQKYAITKESNIKFAFYVGTKSPNNLEVYDMTGNVFEWVGKYYQFYSSPDNISNFDSSGVRILRGGSFSHGPYATFKRAGSLHDISFDDAGFRCAVSAEKY